MPIEITINTEHLPMIPVVIFFIVFLFKYKIGDISKDAKLMRYTKADKDNR